MYLIETSIFINLITENSYEEIFEKNLFEEFKVSNKEFYFEPADPKYTFITHRWADKCLKIDDYNVLRQNISYFNTEFIWIDFICTHTNKEINFISFPSIAFNSCKHLFIVDLNDLKRFWIFVELMYTVRTGKDLLIIVKDVSEKLELNLNYDTLLNYNDVKFNSGLYFKDIIELVYSCVYCSMSLLFLNSLECHNEDDKKYLFNHFDDYKNISLRNKLIENTNYIMHEKYIDLIKKQKRRKTGK